MRDYIGHRPSWPLLAVAGGEGTYRSLCTEFALPWPRCSGYRCCRAGAGPTVGEPMISSLGWRWVFLLGRLGIASGIFTP